MKKTGALGLLLSSLFVYSSFAEANGCESTSPNFHGGHDAYYDLDVKISLSGREKDRLSDFFNSLSGDWEGRLLHIECKGPAGDLTAEFKEAILKAEIKHQGYGVLRIDYDTDFYEEKISRINNIKTLGDDHIYSIDFMDEGRLSFSEKYRRRNAKGAALLVENIYEIQSNDYGLTINITSYYNGYFAWREEMNVN